MGKDQNIYLHHFHNSSGGFFRHFQGSNKHLDPESRVHGGFFLNHAGINLTQFVPPQGLRNKTRMQRYCVTSPVTFFHVDESLLFTISVYSCAQVDYKRSHSVYLMMWKQQSQIEGNKLKNNT